MKKKYIFTALAAVLFVIMTLSMQAGSAQAQDEIFFAVINAGQEVPPVESDALGNALMSLDTTTNMLSYSISFTPLAGTETVAHFHAPEEVGANTGVLFDITGGTGTSPTGSPKTGSVGPLSAQNIQDLRDGLFYINIHSDVSPSGEIRGQVLPVGGTAAPVDTTQLEAFVTRFYDLVLGRAPDQAGFDFWVNGLADDSLTGGDIVRNFFNSAEFTNQNTDNPTYVTTLYNALFGRTPAQTEVDFWVNEITTGTTRDQVLENFIGSPEFIALSQSFGITPS